MLPRAQIEVSSVVQQARSGAEPVVAETLQRIGTHDPEVRAFVQVDERALDAARYCDRAASELGPLHGVPVAVKEVVDVGGLRCEWGTSIHAGRVPTRDASAVAALRDAGAVIVGTTASTEYAIADAPPTRNPHDAARSPGGSSSGSAAAVAAGLVPVAIGTQSIGSIIRPATYCGIFGLKPTFGAVSTRGGMPLSPWLDHVGLLALHLEDLRLACAALFRLDRDDPHSIAVPPPQPYALALRPAVATVLGPFDNRVQEPSATAVRRAQAAFRDAGVMTADVTLPQQAEAAMNAVEVLLCHDMARFHGDDYDRHANAMSVRVQGLIQTGRDIKPSQYDTAVLQRTTLREALLTSLAEQVWLAPATDSVAPPRQEGTGSPILQGIWTLCGFPVLAVPCGQVDGLPVGVQLIAAPGREELLFGAAACLTAAMRASASS